MNFGYLAKSKLLSCKESATLNQAAQARQLFRPMSRLTPRQDALIVLSFIASPYLILCHSHHLASYSKCSSVSILVINGSNVALVDFERCHFAKNVMLKNYEL